MPITTIQTIEWAHSVSLTASIVFLGRTHYYRRAAETKRLVRFRVLLFFSFIFPFTARRYSSLRGIYLGHAHFPLSAFAFSKKTSRTKRKTRRALLRATAARCSPTCLTQLDTLDRLTRFARCPIVSTRCGVPFLRSDLANLICAERTRGAKRRIGLSKQNGFK